VPLCNNSGASALFPLRPQLHPISLGQLPNDMNHPHFGKPLLLSPTLQLLSEVQIGRVHALVSIDQFLNQKSEQFHSGMQKTKCQCNSEIISLIWRHPIHFKDFIFKTKMQPRRVRATFFKCWAQRFKHRLKSFAIGMKRLYKASWVQDIRDAILEVIGREQSTRATSIQFMS
jgi:hypothetical protein